MKNTIMLLIFSLFFTVSFSQTPSFTVYYFNADRSNEAEIAAANRPNWRFFRVPHTPADTPQADMIATDPDTKMPAKWLISNSTIAAKFSAVCYLTAKHISEMLWGDAPFGLIWASWGGTRVEAWAPPASKNACPAAAAMVPEAPVTRG